MPYLDRILACRRHDLSRVRPFVVGGERLGVVRHETAERLAGIVDTFRVAADAVVLSEALNTPAERTAALGRTLEILRSEGRVGDDRAEPFPVVRAWGEEPRCLLDRSALALFGARAFGVHVNGYVERPDGLQVWVARRSARVHVDPGKLDHIVAGGQPHGLTLIENVVKECAEEASIPEALARQARFAGLFRYRLDVEEGLKDDTIYAFDLALPPDFVPRGADGEVAGFELWPVARLLERVRDTDDFKFNVGPVILDFALRRGLLDADAEGIAVLAEVLHEPGEPGPR